MGIFKRKNTSLLRLFNTGDCHKILSNPYNGAYHLHLFQIGNMDNDGELNLIGLQKDVSLQLLEFDLQKYSASLIDEEGLKQLEAIFERLKNLPVKLIIRFLYDSDGHALKHEPYHITTIYEHMKQLKPLIRAYEKQIHIIQGMFIGNWGEMNGSRFIGPSYLVGLAENMKQLVGDNLFMAVRTPSQRRILEKRGIDVSRISLFNDGLLGTDRDLGTYGVKRKMYCEYEEPWHRDDELLYQNEICLRVPNGGEAIGDNANSDFANVVNQFRFAHISYINFDYDQRTLNKWKNIKVSGGYENGFDYIISHLGYRYRIADVLLKSQGIKKKNEVKIKVVNDGFSPAYYPLRFVLSVKDKEYEFDLDPTRLPGGDQYKKQETLRFEITDDLYDGDLLYLKAYIDDKQLSFSNTGYEEEKGLLIGKIEIN